MGKDERGRESVCVCGVEKRSGGRSGSGKWDIGAERVKSESGRNYTKEKCAFERVCMKDCLVQPLKDIEPAFHQMTCDPKANKMAMCCPAAISF